MIKLNKNTLQKDLFNDLENFRFKEGSWGPWDSILDAIPETDKCKKDSLNIIINIALHQSFKKIGRKIAENISGIFIY